MSQGGSIRRRMYGPCSGCGFRALVNGTGLLKVHNHKTEPLIGVRCPGSGTRPTSCDCNAPDCWACQIDGSS